MSNKNLTIENLIKTSANNLFNYPHDEVIVKAEIEQLILIYNQLFGDKECQ